jgi:riboflavin kinase/FMN adenylyltransferase
LKIIRGLLQNRFLSAADKGLLKNGCVATIGNFDGVHLAHQALLKRMVSLAREKKVPSIVITFEPHPNEFFKKESCFPRLTSLHEKALQFEKQEVDFVFVFPFNLALSKMSAEMFSQKILKKELNITYLIVGDDFHFGYDRRGHAEELKKYFDGVEQHESFCNGGVRISSSKIREFLKNADFESAKQMLGRDYSICGKVIHGDKRGRTIGFPTANIHLKNRKLPMNGVFAVHVMLKNKVYSGIANVGVRPSIKTKDKVHLEVHILNFNQEIYGEHLEVVFLRKIRDEKKFSSLEMLKNQLQKDVKNKTIRVSAPGSIMLLGEHAVLRGYPAVSCAIDRRITVDLVPREDNRVEINSDVMGKITFSLDDVPSFPAFRFVLKVIADYQPMLSCGFDLTIQSGFSDKVGLGSSAAVTVAMVAALELLTKPNDELPLHLQWRIFEKSVEIIRAVQGLGSGADVAASVFGGIIAYQVCDFEDMDRHLSQADDNKFSIQQLDVELPIHLIYMGHKTPTVEVVQKVNQRERQNPEHYKQLFSAMGQLTYDGIAAIKKEDIKRLGEIFNIHQELQEALGVSDDNTNEIIHQLKNEAFVYGVKISGSGLGDCVVALGDFSKSNFSLNEEQKKKGMCHIPVSVENKGLILGAKK